MKNIYTLASVEMKFGEVRKKFEKFESKVVTNCCLNQQLFTFKLKHRQIEISRTGRIFEVKFQRYFPSLYYPIKCIHRLTHV